MTDDTFREWHRQNQWYLNDPETTIYANGVASTREELRQLPYREYLDAVGNEVKRTFSHKFTNPNRAAPAAVDGGSTSQSSNRPQDGAKRAFEGLPHDAREKCDSLIKQGLIKNREQYLKHYQED